jgi:GMP synthase (glutamine-hydrolysing)
MHSDAIAELPPDAEWLASSAQYPFHAFRIGSALAVQFHPEASAATMCSWATQAGVDPAPIEGDMSTLGRDLATLADAIAAGFLAEVRAERRRTG